MDALPLGSKNERSSLCFLTKWRQARHVLGGAAITASATDTQASG